MLNIRMIDPDGIEREVPYAQLPHAFEAGGSF